VGVFHKRGLLNKDGFKFKNSAVVVVCVEERLGFNAGKQ
tara:strand:- start:1660 stop:1776 length:117 start_codon:yes stop_codon:yes gene_type:complete